MHRRRRLEGRRERLVHQAEDQTGPIRLLGLEVTTLEFLLCRRFAFGTGLILSKAIHNWHTQFILVMVLLLTNNRKK